MRRPWRLLQPAVVLVFTATFAWRHFSAPQSAGWVVPRSPVPHIHRAEDPAPAISSKSTQRSWSEMIALSSQRLAEHAASVNPFVQARSVSSSSGEQTVQYSMFSPRKGHVPRPRALRRRLRGDMKVGNKPGPSKMAKPQAPPSKTTTTTLPKPAPRVTSGGGKRPKKRQYKTNEKWLVFSLFSSSGTPVPDEFFTAGIVHNIFLARQVFPDWLIHIYMAESLDPRYIDMMEELGADVELCPFQKKTWMDGMFWRFWPADENIERFLVRDLDGRLSWRERLAVDEWIKEGTAFHSIKDHPMHSIPVMGGMWGGVGNMLQYGDWKGKPHKTMKELCNAYPGKNGKGQDQSFLAAKVWPIMRSNVTEHNVNIRGKTGCKYCRPMPNGVPGEHKTDYHGYYFVGAAYGKDRVHNTLDCSHKPRCTHVCRSYQDEYKQMTHKEWNFPWYPKMDTSKPLKCQWIDYG